MSVEKNGSAPAEEETPSRPKIWWNNRSTLEKRLIIATLVCLAVLLLIFLIYFLATNKPEVCTSSTCVRTSMELSNYLDVKVDPCEDFYRFSCGNFLQQNTNLNPDNHDAGSRLTVKSIMEDEIKSQIRNMLEEPVYSRDPVAFNLAKKFYRACMNESAVEAEGLEGMKQIFKQIGGWPTIVGHNWRESQFDWKEAVHKLRGIGINFESFVILSVKRNKADPTRYILNLEDPSYSTSEVRTDVKQKYLEYMVDTAILFGASKERARKEQYEVMQFLLRLAKITEEVQNSKNGSEPSLRSLSELQYEFPFSNKTWSWEAYINKILAPASQITYDDTISVSHPMYLKKLLELLRTTNKRVIANFMSWHTLQHLINYLPAAVLDRAYDYLTKVNGKITREPRWSMCVSSTQSRMGTVVAAAYVEKYFEEESRRRAVSMIQRIKRQFRKNLRDLNWLDQQTKDMALEKVASSVEDIPSLQRLMQQSRVYEEAEIIDNKLLLSVLNLDYINTNLQYEKLHEHDWSLDDPVEMSNHATGMSILYSRKKNALQLPIGIFQGVFYQKDRPEYMNYGALGTIIAHEIYHIIIEAEYRNLQGDLRSWWSSHSLLNYEEKLQCLSNHYGKFIVSKIEQQHNTSNPRDEEMADLVGMKVSYDTYINWVQENRVEPQLPGLNYSPNQLFWISSAIHHCSKSHTQTFHQGHTSNYQEQEQDPEQLRVNGALQNIQEFAYDFACPVGAKMNPPHKCQLW